MKNFILSICVIVSAVAFSSYKPTAGTVAIVAPTLNTFNVSNVASYADYNPACPPGGSRHCRLDLGLITTYSANNAAQLVNYLNLYFFTPQDRLNEVTRITVAWRY